MTEKILLKEANLQVKEEEVKQTAEGESETSNQAQETIYNHSTVKQ
jgi:hypothetical protein